MNDPEPRYAWDYFERGLVCSQHAHTGPGPCPWPGCPAGVAGSRILGVSSLSGTERHFRRMQYTNSAGDARFLWADDRGTFFTAGRRVEQEIRRRGLGSAHAPPTAIYHYTEPSALLGILSSQEVWLTDYAYLNDSSEIEHGLALSRAALTERRNTVSDAIEMAVLDAGLDEINRTDGRRLAVACFSAVRDSLPQWRAYGSIAIGFRVESLAFGYAPGAVLDQVIYNSTVQHQHLEVTIHEHLEASKIDHRLGRSDNPAVLGSILAGRIIQRIGFFKNPSFAEEREVRYCFVEDAQANNALSAPTAPKRFRVKGKSIIPYVSSRDLIFRNELYGETSSAHRLPIVEVVIGPSEGSELAARGVRELLDHYDYHDAVVRHSEVPYRTF